jgi:hypothetical protein
MRTIDQVVGCSRADFRLTAAAASVNEIGLWGRMPIPGPYARSGAMVRGSRGGGWSGDDYALGAEARSVSVVGLPDGVHAGAWSGYIVRVGSLEFKTDLGIRCMGWIPVAVIVKAGRATVREAGPCGSAESGSADKPGSLLDAFAGPLRVITGQHGSKAIHPKIEVTAEEAAHLLEGLVRVDVSQLQKSTGAQPGFGRSSPMPILRGIQAGTVRYDAFDPDEEWKTWSQLVGELQTKGKAVGDCEDLSSAVAAELRFAGIPARTYVYKSGPRLYHVIVATEKWGYLDPSRQSGMEGEGR